MKNAKAKHGLNLKMGFKTRFGLIWRTKKTVEGKGGGKKREKEEEEEKKKRRRGEAKIKKVWKLTLSMEIMKISRDLWISKVLYG